MWWALIKFDVFSVNTGACYFQSGWGVLESGSQCLYNELASLCRSGYILTHVVACCSIFSVLPN